MASSHFFVLLLTKQVINPEIFLRDDVQITVEINPRNAITRTTDRDNPFHALVVDLDHLGDTARDFLRTYTERPMQKRRPLIIFGRNTAEAKAVAEEFDADHLPALTPRQLAHEMYDLTGTSSSRGFTRGLATA